jgi:transcriptional regulator with XRE-family HTH domain
MDAHKDADAMSTMHSQTETEQTVDRIRSKMGQWGITLTFLAGELGVSRQYAWQVVRNRIPLSARKAQSVERAVDAIIERQAHLTTFGARLRAARLAAGLTLKQVASMIGYSWVGVERWEKDVCVPKPGVLWHLFSLYGTDQELIVPVRVRKSYLKRAS